MKDKIEKIERSEIFINPIYGNIEGLGVAANKISELSDCYAIAFAKWADYYENLANEKGINPKELYLFSNKLRNLNN